MKSNTLVIVATFAVGGVIGSWASLTFFDRESTELGDRIIEESAANESGAGKLAPKAEAEQLVGVVSEEPPMTFDERVELALSHDSYRRRQYELERLFENLTANEAETVLGEILEVKEPRLRGDLLRPFFVKWGELDGAYAFSKAVELTGRNRNDGVSAVLAGWSHTDVHAAWQEAIVMIDESASPFNRLTRGAVAEMAKQDPDVLLELLAKDSANQKYSFFGHSLVNEAFETDSQQQLLSKLSVIENAADRNKLVAMLFQRWGALDTEAPLDSMAKLQDPVEAKSALEGFLKGWIESDRDGALDYAFENQADPAVQASFASMLQMSMRDASTADNEALIARLKEQGLLSEVATKIGPHLAFMQPEIALQVAEAIEDPKERARQIQRSISGLARADMDKARDYVEKVESLEERANLVASMSNAMSNRSDGGAQLISIMEGMPDGKDRKMVIERLLGSASRSPDRLSSDYREGLTVLAEAQSDLSEKAKESLLKLAEAQL